MIKLPSIFVIFCIIILYNEVTSQMETNPTYQNLGQYLPSESQSKPFPYPYYGGINPFPYYQSQYLNNYPNYAPNFFPGHYVLRYYPSLYQEFPNGFYVLPDAPSFSSNAGAQPTNDIVTKYAENGNSQQSEGVKRDINSPQKSEYYIPYHTNLGQQKSYISNVEMKPVSTILTRYRGSDGKTYVKLVTSDSDGKEKVTDSEYNGKLNFKINNGVVEPSNSGTNMQPEIIDNTVTLETTTNDNSDPNSVIQQMDIRSGDGLEDKRDTEKPTDVNSWYS